MCLLQATSFAQIQKMIREFVNPWWRDCVHLDGGRLSMSQAAAALRILRMFIAQVKGELYFFP